MANNELLSLVKNSLSIVEESTVKDLEIKMLIDAAISDMKRQGISVMQNINDSLVKGTIVMYVKGNFGMIDINDKKIAIETYKNNCANLSLSENYRVVE